MTGVTIRVDRFGQVQLVDGAFVFRRDVVPTDPDDDGVYSSTSLTAPRFKASDRVDMYQLDHGYVVVPAGTDLTGYGIWARPTHRNITVTDPTTEGASS